MKLDNIDISIVFYLTDNKNQTTSNIAKAIFNCPSKKELLSQDAMVRYRLENLERDNIIVCNNTNPRTYNINPKCFVCGNGTLDIKVNGGKSVEIEFGSFLVVTDGKNYIYVNRVIHNGEQEKISIVS